MTKVTMEIQDVLRPRKGKPYQWYRLRIPGRYYRVRLTKNQFHGVVMMAVRWLK